MSVATACELAGLQGDPAVAGAEAVAVAERILRLMMLLEKAHANRDPTEQVPWEVEYLDAELVVSLMKHGFAASFRQVGSGQQ